MKTSLYKALPFALLFFSCSNGGKTNESESQKEMPGYVVLTDAQLKQAAIETSTASNQEMASVLKVHGLIDVPPQNMVTISVPMGGYLKESHLLPGSRVKKGEQIAVIEDQQYISLQQDYLTAAAKLEFAKEEYKRQRDLNVSKATSDKVFQQITADYSAQRVQLKALSEKLRLIGIDPGKLNEENLSKSVNIVSPIDGYVSNVNVNIGKYVRPEDELFELVNPTDLHLSLRVFEKDLEDIYIGQELEAYTNNRPEKKYPGEIILIGKDLNEDRSLEVHCHFKNADPSMIPGLYMNADIRLKKAAAEVLPAEAIVSHEGHSYVFRMADPHRFELIRVTPGQSIDGNTEVKWEGTAPGSEARFVTKGAYALLMTMMNVAE